MLGWSRESRQLLRAGLAFSEYYLKGSFKKSDNQKGDNPSLCLLIKSGSLSVPLPPPHSFVLASFPESRNLLGGWLRRVSQALRTDGNL